MHYSDYTQLLQAGLGNPQSEIFWMMDWLPIVTKTNKTQEGNPWELLSVINTMDAIIHVALNAAMRLDGDAVSVSTQAAGWGDSKPV